MLKKDIKDNAGIIWHLLLEKKILSIRQIEEYTGYKEVMIVLSLGWLAKENKVNFIERNENIHIEIMSPFKEIYY